MNRSFNSNPLDSGPSPATDRFVALMYHNICESHAAYSSLSPSATSYFVDQSTFDDQLSELSASGAACMDLEGSYAFFGVGRRTDSSVSSNRRTVLLTFDDGWSDAVEIGGPLLARHGCRTLLFVTTDFLDRPHFLTRGQLSRLDPNLFRIGSHARSHRMLSLLDEPEIRAELNESRKILEDIVGYAVDTLSIPSGAVDDRVRRIALECGYRLVFDSEIRINRIGDNPAAIGRVPVMQHTTLTTFRNYVRHRIRRQQLRRAVLQAPKRLLGLRRYEALRRHLLGEQRGQRVTHSS